MTQTARPAPRRKSNLRTVLVILLVLVLLLPLMMFAGVALIVWTSPSWLPPAGAALAERFGYQLTLEGVELPGADSLLNGGLLNDGLKLARFELSDSDGVFRLAASRLKFDWSLDSSTDGSAKLTIADLDLFVDPAALDNSKQAASTDDGESLSSSGEHLADMLQRLSQPLPDLGGHLPSRIARHFPRAPVDFRVVIDDLWVGAHSSQYEQETAWTGRLEISVTDYSRPAAEMSISSSGQLVLPAALRTFPAEGLQKRSLLSASLAPAVPLTLDARASPEDINLRVVSDYGVVDLKLLAAGQYEGGLWDLTVDASLDTAGLQAGLRLPAHPPMMSAPVPLELTRGKLKLDAALRLGENLLPLKQQPADAHLAADLDLKADGGPGTLVWRQSIKLARGLDDLSLEFAPVKVDLNPVGVWWKTNEWFVNSGLQPALLQPWKLRSEPIRCRAKPTVVDALLDTASADTTMPALRKLLASCGWPLALRLSTAAQKPGSVENALTIELLPDFEAADGSAQDLTPKALRVNLSGAGTRLHSQMPDQWSLASSVGLRPRTSQVGFDVQLADTSLYLQSLNQPGITIDRLAVQSRQLDLVLTGSGALRSAKGDIKGDVTALPSASVLSKPLAAALDTNFTLKVSETGPLPDISFDLRRLSAAGLELGADLTIDRQLKRMSGDFRLSGTPDSQLMGALRDTLANALPQVPELKVKAGKLLYSGHLTLNAESQLPQWSASGIAGLQGWTITNEQIKASRVTLSTKFEADQSGVTILSEGEAFSTLSADLSLGKLPFPGAFIKLAADLTFPAPASSGEPARPLAGTVKLQQAHISAFKGNIELTDSVVIELPLTRMEKAPARIPIALRSIDLGALVALENEQIDATGTVSGRLGLVYNGKSLRIPASSPGKLSADGTGWIRLKEAGKWQDMAGGNPQLLFALGALSNFRYDSLKSTVVFDDNEWLNLALELQGSNPDVRDGRSIHYNLNVQSNILSLLKSLAVTENLSRSLEERVLKAYE